MSISDLTFHGRYGGILQSNVQSSTVHNNVPLTQYRIHSTHTRFFDFYVVDTLLLRAVETTQPRALIFHKPASQRSTCYQTLES